MTNGSLRPLQRVGSRVRVATPVEADLGPYRHAVEASRGRLAPWNPVNPSDLAYHLAHQSSAHRTFVVHALDAAGSHGIVGKVNVTNVQRSRALSASMGYDSYDPYAGTGMFREGLRLVIDIALSDEPEGMGLHRVEAAVQPSNVRSAGLLRRIGLRRRGSWPEYLWLSDEHNQDAWRDHVIYGVTRRQWWAAHDEDWVSAAPARPLIVLQADPEKGVTPGAVAVARVVATELGVPVLRDDGREDVDRVSERLADAVTGAVVVTASPAERMAHVLVAAGVDTVPVVGSVDRIRGARDVVALALDARAAAGVDDRG